MEEEKKKPVVSLGFSAMMMIMAAGGIMSNRLAALQMADLGLLVFAVCFPIGWYVWKRYGGV